MPILHHSTKSLFYSTTYPDVLCFDISSSFPRHCSPQVDNTTSLHYLTVSATEGRTTPWIADSMPFFTDER